MALKHGYFSKPTRAELLFQNGIVERSHSILAKIIRYQLSAVGLPSLYWSFSLLHSMYLINRLPPNNLPITPIKVYTGTQSNCSNIKVFGCKLVTRQTGFQSAKLDDHAFVGAFLHYSATDQNVYYIDSLTSVIKIFRHHIFDEYYSTSLDTPHVT